MKKKASIFIALIISLTGIAQTGSFTATFISPEGKIKPVTIAFSKPVFKFDNPHGYWFVNPYNAARHFNTMPEPNMGNAPAGYITFNGKENDFDIYQSSNDSNSVSVSNPTYVISAPPYDPKLADKLKPMHVHINTFSASEISFTISGIAEIGTISGSSGNKSLGSITGSGHFYREPQYAKSEVLPGCNCDPTIYAAVYDKEEGVRTKSACEVALSNKIFDAVQQAMAPLFTNVQYNGPTGDMQPGSINIDMLPGCVDLKVPVKERPYCSSDYYHNGLTAFNAEQKIYNNEDGYGLRFIKIPPADLGRPDPAKAEENNKWSAHFMDSIMKLAAAQKITSAQLESAMKEMTNRMSGGTASLDLKEMEVDHNLYVHVIINPDNRETMLLKVADKNKTLVQHTIKNDAFEIFSPKIKESDGSWISNRMFVYLGKFTTPVMGKSGGGYDAETTTALYPVKANRLSVYHIIIKMEGAKDLIDKAMTNIDFNALQNLITKQ
ncbi:MAG: hypothetical protein ABJA78_17235 [Ferruginibacter sp.]